MKKNYLLTALLFAALFVNAQSIVSVSPSTIPSSGIVTLTLTGYHTFFLSHSGYSAHLSQPDNSNTSVYNSTSTTVINNETIQATFNISNPMFGGYYRVQLTAGGGYIINWLENGVFMTGTRERRLLTCTPNLNIAGSTLTAQVTGADARFMTATGFNRVGSVQLISDEVPNYVINGTSINPVDSNTLNVDFTIPSTHVNNSYKMVIDEYPFGLGQIIKAGFFNVTNGVDKGIVNVTPNISYKGDSVYMTVQVTGTNLLTYPLIYTGVLLGGEINNFTLSAGATSITAIDATHSLIKWKLGTQMPEGDYYLRLYNSNIGYFYKHYAFRVKPPKLTGQIYFDIDSNGVKNGSDFGIQGHSVMLLPDSVISITDNQGIYVFNPDTGIYSIQYIPDALWTLSSLPSVYSNIHVADTLQVGFDFGIHTQAGFRHTFTIWNHPLRCNYTGFSYWEIHNPELVPHIGTVRQIHSSNLPVSYTQIPPDYVNGDTLIWNYVIPSQQTLHCDVHYLDPPAGDTVWYSYKDVLTASQAQYTDSFNFIVTCSCDPNDKSVMALGDPSQLFTSDAVPLLYNINFQNTGTDTAFLVVIRDTISPLLDLNTFEIVSSSHSLLTTIDIPKRIVTFTFDDIMLPDSFVNEPGSHGFVRYKIKPKTGLPPGTVVNNTAYIYFDFNLPVATNVASEVLSFATWIDKITTSAFEIYPNPTTGQFTVSDSQFPIKRIEVFDVLGEAVYSSGSVNCTSCIVTAELSVGVYFVKTTTEKGSKVMRLVKE